MANEINIIHEFDQASIDKLLIVAEQLKNSLGAKVNVGQLEKTIEHLKAQLEVHKRITGEQQKQKEETDNIFVKQKSLKIQLELAKKELGQTHPELIKLKREYDEVNKKVREFNAIGKTASNTWGAALSSFQFKFNALGNIMANVVNKAFRTFQNLLKGALTTIVDFEQAMADVRAVSGATSEQFKQLTQDAIRLGGSTIFTAKQVGELQLAYAKLGFSTVEILNATEATLNLAAATGEGLGESARIAGAVLRAFNMDAIQMGEVVDTMAMSFTKSALDLEKFRESMKFVAPVARQAGFSLADTTAILAKLADTGLYGSLAGTALRNVFLRLADSNSALAKRLGTTVRNFDDLIAALRKLNDEGVDIAEILALTDRRAVTAFATLVKYGPMLDDMRKKLEDVRGEAQRIAEIKMGTIRGETIKLTSAWEGLTIQVGESTSAVLEFARTAISKLTELVGHLKDQLTDEYTKATFEGLEKAKVYYENFAKDREAATREELRTSKAVGNEKTELEKQIAEKNIAIAQDYFNQFVKVLEDGNDEYERVRKDYVNLEEKNRRDEQGKSLSFLQIEEIKRRYFELEMARSTNKSLLEMFKNYIDSQLKFHGDLVAESIALEEKEYDNWVKLEELRIAGMKDNIFKEEESIKLKYTKLIREAKEYGVDTVALNQKMTDEIEALWTKMWGQITEAGKGFAKRQAADIFEEFDMMMDELSDEFYVWQEKQFDESVKSGEELSGKLIKESIDRWNRIRMSDEEAADLRIQGQRIMFNEMMKLSGAYSQFQENKMWEEIDRINKLPIAEEEKEKKIDEIRRKYAKKQQLISIAQAVIDTAAAIVKIGAQMGVAALPFQIAAGIVGAAQIAMIASQKFAKGGWVDGEPHSRGGVPIEAEGGEFIIRKERARQFDSILESINSDPAHKVWNNLNIELNKKAMAVPSININNRKVEQLLQQLVDVTESTPKDMGKYFVWKHKGITYKIKK